VQLLLGCWPQISLLKSVPESSNIEAKLELIKCKVGLLALTIDPGKKDVNFGAGKLLTAFSLKTITGQDPLKVFLLFLLI
jgi:hypothetical protein